MPKRKLDISPLGLFRAAIFLALLCCAAISVWSTRHWPLVGDASLMHYVVFLMQHGMAPYRDIVDINMPGSYFVAWLEMHVFGTGPANLRAFDFFLLGVAAVAMIVIARTRDWIGGFYAAALLVVLHLRDGVDQSGQRDLTAAVLLIVSCAFFFHARRGGRLWAFALAGLCIGIAATIKPSLAPFLLVLLGISAVEWKQNSKSTRAMLIWTAIGFLVPFCVTALFLARDHALRAFWWTLTGLVPYHASIGRLPAGYLALHSVPSALWPLAILCVLAGIVLRNWERWELATLWLGFVIGILSVIAQGKGYPYHRYPAEAFLLLLAGINFTGLLKRPWLVRLIGIAGLALGAFALAPVSTAKTLHYEWWNQEFITSLQGDLNKLGGKNLSGGVQCMDTTAGCINTLDRMRLQQDTGFLYDCYLFAPRPSPVQLQLQQRFWTAIHDKPPEIFIVTNQLCVSGPSNYAKLDQWPQFQGFLDANYSLILQRSPVRPVRWWSHAASPFAYRIYERKPVE
jgi:hypothetical protein